MKMITVGGGTGGSIIDAALSAKFPDLVSVVTSFDNGGSSGILKYEFGMLPQGDIRRRIFAQKTVDNPVLEQIYNFRFLNDKGSSLDTHTVGNLMILAATKIWGEKEGIEKICEMFKIRGKVLPVTYDYAELAAKIKNGEQLIGESIIGQTKIDKRDPFDKRKIEKVFLTKKTKLNKQVKEQILHADYIILAPGDFYTSLIPNFLVPGFREAVKRAKRRGAKVVLVSNVMTKAAETDGFRLSDFVNETEKYLGEKVDYILFNKTKINKRLLQKYKKEENASPVVNDLLQKDLRVREVDMLKQNGNIRHDKKLFREAFEKLIKEEKTKKPKLYVFDLDGTVVNTGRYGEEFFGDDYKNLKLVEGVEALFKKIGKQNLILLTYDKHGNQTRKIKHLKLSKFFRKIIVVKQNENKKVELKKIKKGNSTKEIWVVGDRHENSELEYALELGMKTICVAFPENKYLNPKYHKEYDMIIDKAADFALVI